MLIRRLKRRISHWGQQRALRLVSGGILSRATLNSAWEDMRYFLSEARRVDQKAQESGRSFHEVDLHWEAYLYEIGKFLEGPPRVDFLGHPGISSSMGRGARAGVDEREIPLVISAIQEGFFGTPNIETSLGVGMGTSVG